MPITAHRLTLSTICLCVMIIAGLVGPAIVFAEQTQIAPEEYAALVALHEAMGGAGWTTPWVLPTDTPCWDLPGVQCSASSGPYWAEVTGLGLSANGLSGAIPEALTSLSHLTDLDLSENGLTGGIPASLGTLDSLRLLNLSKNQLSGPIPPELGNLGDLQYLLANENKLSGPIPPELGNLTSLWGLALYDNQLSGGIPESLGNLGALTHVDLANNALGGPIPPEIGQVGSLHTLNLGGNQLSGAIPDALGDLVNLRYLFLFSNELVGPIPDALGQISGLYSLSLGGNYLEGPIPEALSAMSNLWLLSLSENRLSGPIPEFVGSFDNLYWLALEYNAFSGPVPSSLANLADLTWLRLGHNMLWCEDPALEAFLAEKDTYWDTTQTLPPAEVHAMPTGRGARVTWTPSQGLAGDGYYEVGIATTPGGPYTPAEPVASLWDREVIIRGLEPGETYYLAVRAFRPSWLPQKNDLLTPYSEEASVIPERYDIPEEEYGALVALHDATGGPDWATPWDLPAEDPCSLHGVTCSAGHVARLRLARNNLRGSLPDAISVFTGLQELDLQGNQLSGAIPEALGSLARLAVLRLDTNALHGPLPVAMQNLAHLGSLNLGYNMLWADDATLAERLAVLSPGWDRTQTVPPTGVAAEPLLGGARLTWQPGSYRVSGGYYEVGASTNTGGPYTPLATTADQAASGIDVAGLEPGISCYLAVRAHTPSQGEQTNDLTSPYGAEVRVTPPFTVVLPWLRR